MLVFKSNNLTVEAEGTSETVPVKRLQVTTMSTNGKKNRTNRRVVNNYTITVTKMSSEEYKKFQDMFAYENDFTFTDTDNGYYGVNYGIDGESFTALTPTENKSEKNKYYTGNFTIEQY